MQLIGQKRELLGKKVKYLRNDRQLPSAIFGKGKESISISVNSLDFAKVFSEAGETSVIDLVIDGASHPVLVKDVQVHHITGAPIHVGFYEVNLLEKINANIPVEIINEEENELVKSGEALVLTLVHEIEVEALPTDLPDKFEVDALKLVDMDAVITTKDLVFDRAKVEITDLEEDEVIAKLDYAQMLEEEEPEVVDEAAAIAGIEALAEKPEVEGEEGEKEEEK